MSLRVRILQVDVPQQAVEDATGFWGPALGATPLPAPGGFLHLSEAAAACEVHLQPLVDGSARYHLDLEADDLDAEVARLVGLGARELWRDETGYVVLADPAGLPLCVIDPEAAEPAARAPRPAGRGYLEGLFVDVPAELVAAEVAFWAGALAARAEEAADGSPYTALRGVAAPDGTALTFEVQAVDAPPRYHVDLSAPDVAAEAARLEALGALRVAEIEGWITLSDPVGNLLCVVAR